MTLQRRARGQQDRNRPTAAAQRVRTSQQDSRYRTRQQQQQQQEKKKQRQAALRGSGPRASLFPSLYTAVWTPSGRRPTRQQTRAQPHRHTAPPDETAVVTESVFAAQSACHAPAATDVPCRSIAASLCGRADFSREKQPIFIIIVPYCTSMYCEGFPNAASALRPLQQPLAAHDSCSKQPSSFAHREYSALLRHRSLDDDQRNSIRRSSQVACVLEV